jgi:hypothetical protein
MEVLSPKFTNKGEILTFSVTAFVDGGTFSWNAPGATPAMGNGQSFQMTYADTGMKTISVTFKHTNGTTETANKIIRINDLSGKSWPQIADKNGWKNSTNIKDLDPSFKGKVQKFTEALKNAGIVFAVESTFRPEERAYLMHYAWQIAHGREHANAIPIKENVFIEWKHLDAAGNFSESDSIHAAMEMVAAFHIDTKNKNAPAEKSMHTVRAAIDMEITKWSGKKTIKDASGISVEIDSAKNQVDNKGNLNVNLNKDLIKVGNSFGLLKLTNPQDDPNHWSFNGR